MRRVGFRLRHKYAARKALFEALANKPERREKTRAPLTRKQLALTEIVSRLGVGGKRARG